MRLAAIVLALLLAASALCASALVPSIANPGFEEKAPGNDAPGWGWYNRATASFRSETVNPHSGARCLVFTNGSDLAPEVYGRLFQNVGVMPGTKYELSVWVRGEDVAGGQHFTDWSSYTLNLPKGTFGWQKVSTTFTTKDGQRSLNLGINVVNKCKALAIDDITLRPVGRRFAGQGIYGSFFLPGQVSGDNAPAVLTVLANSSLTTDATLEAVIRAGGEVIFQKSGVIKIGENSMQWEWNSGDAATRRLDCQMRVLDSTGKVIAVVTDQVEKLSPKVISADLDGVQARMAEFDKIYNQCRAKGIALDYPTVTRTMLTQFLPFAREDLTLGEERRANFDARDLNQSLDNAIAEMKAYLNDPKLAPNARRYVTSPMAIDGISFIADRKDDQGKISRGPVFFCGYGHFGRVREDMDLWPGYGVNIIQIEIGPSSTLLSENEVSLKAAEDVAKVLDNAAKRNVKVNVLLSPHYFPSWALAKWPNLAKGGGGFLGFCVDAPEAKQVIEKFLRAVVPLLKDKPALHSFCLSNEPMFDRGAACDNTRPMWEAYLARVHGDVAAMNQRYGTKYASFAEVPIPANDAYAAPQFYDYIVFNQERFAGWHKWMADVIHSMAPDVPVHAKAMWIPISWRYSVACGLDPERFGELSQINGNDCVIQPGNDDAPIFWGEQNMYYDLQRSVARKPIFNSENHLQPDGSTSYVAPEHYRTALWQGAIHGQGATTIWVWERSKGPNAPGYGDTASFYGSVMDRPGCAEAVGTTCLDLNRFAEEVTALQNAPAPVAILYSMTSFARNSNYLGAIGRAYTALNFCGVKIDFISDKQLAAGKGAQYRMIVCPDATNVPQATFDGVRDLPSKTRLVLIGDSLGKDPYGNPFPADAIAELRRRAIAYPAETASDKLWPELTAELGKLGGLPQVSVVDAATGKPAWGVEWLTAKIGSRTVANLVNLTTKPIEVRFIASGRQVRASDMLSLGGLGEVRVLKPITPVLAEVGS